MYNIVSKLDVPRDQRWQAVVLLWLENHAAFLRGNLHGLLVDARLTVPADFEYRLGVIDKETSQRIITNQWDAWRQRQVTTAAEALAITAGLKSEGEGPIREGIEEPANKLLSQHDTAIAPDSTNPAPQEQGSGEDPPVIAAPESAEVHDAATAGPALAESIADDSTANAELPTPPVEPRAPEMAPPPEEFAPDDGNAAVAPPQVMRLPTEEGSTFVSTQELKLLLGNLENRLLRRLAPVQEIQNGSSFVSPTELHVSLQDLENRLTQRVEQIVARRGMQVAPERPEQRQTSLPPPGLEFIAGIQMPPAAYLLVLINVILLVFSLSLGWHWWRQSSRGGP